MMSRLHARCENLLLGVVAMSVLYRAGASDAMPWVVAVAGACCVIGSIGIQGHERLHERGARLFQYQVLFFVLLLGLSLFHSSTRTTGVDRVALDYGLMLLFLWMLGWGHGRKEEKEFDEHLFRVLAHAAAVLPFLLLLVFLLDGQVPDVLLVFVPSDPALSQLLLLLWPLSWWMRRSSSSPLSWEIVTGLLLGLLLITGSLITLALAAGQVFLLYFLGGRKRVERMATARAGVVALVAGAAIGLFLWKGGDMSFSFPLFAHGLEAQWEWWRSALQLAVERPVFGWGPGSFGYLYPQLQESLVPHTTHPHSLLLRLAVESGIVALLCAAVIAGTILRNIRRQFRQGMSAQAVAGTTAVAAAGFALLVDEDPSAIGLPFILVLLIGMLARSPSVRASSFSPWSSRGVFRRILLTGAAVSLLLLSVREVRYLFLRSFANVSFALGEDERAAYWYGSSMQSWQTEDRFIREAAIAFRAGDVAGAEKKIRAHVARNSYDAGGWRLLGDLLLPDDPKRAIMAYERAFRLDGGNHLSIDRAYLSSLLIAAQEGNSGMAREKMERVLAQIRAHLRAWETADARSFPSAQVERNRKEAEEMRPILASAERLLRPPMDPPPSPPLGVPVRLFSP